MRRYWLRIALGALVIFALGMAAISLTRRGVREFDTLAKSAGPIGIPLALLPFRFEGEQVGTVRRLELLRSSPKTVSGIRLTVKLQDSAAAANLRNCALTLHEPRAFGGREGFGCAPPADSGGEHLERVGEVVFEPGGVVRAVLAPAGRAAEWRASLYDTSEAQAELARVRDPSGKEVLRLHADSNGARLSIPGDSSGRKR